DTSCPDTSGTQRTYQDQYGSIYSDPSQPSGPLSQSDYGTYYDSNGQEWAWSDSDCWLKTIADVRSTPNDLQAYVTAYNGINAMGNAMDWFLMFAFGPEELAGAAPESQLAERFGLRGAMLEEALLLDATLNKLVNELGASDITNMTSKELNDIMAGKGYTTAPFSNSVNGVEFSAQGAATSGSVADSSLFGSLTLRPGHKALAREREHGRRQLTKSQTPTAL
ncbi:MAG: hypothetical protein GIW97_07290, partial [Candidatus Eremiobacteraeota bacterium]|nr:hypothetical protein [Candidatus Eremiobacteraeota bacterium]